MATRAMAPEQTNPAMLSRVWAALVGLVGVGSGLAVGDLVAGLLNPPTSRFLAAPTRRSSSTRHQTANQHRPRPPAVSRQKTRHGTSAARAASK